jgi:CRISPR-associated endonuclease/helicase Cas3
MRTLTHQTFDRVGKILQRLQLDTEVTIHKLVGGTGETMDRSWCNYIDRPSIIIGTQDQILSRQLFKGYATSRWEWSVHAALLNNDEPPPVKARARSTTLGGALAHSMDCY